MIFSIMWCPECQSVSEIGGTEDKCSSCNSKTSIIGWIEDKDSPNDGSQKKSKE